MEQIVKKRLLDMIADNRKIVLQSVNVAARYRPAYKCAIEDNRGELHTGVEIFDDPDFAKHPAQPRKAAITKVSKKMFIADDKVAEKNQGDNTPQYAIDHNMKLDLSKDKDAALLLLIFLDGSIALSKGAVNKIQHHFYIDDKKAEAANKLQILTNKESAFGLIKQVKPTELDEYVALLKIYTRPMNHDIHTKQLALYERADSKPMDIVNLFADKMLEWKLILQRMINSDIVRHDPFKKQFTVNGHLIGTTFDEALTYITDDKNQGVVNEWRKEKGVPATAE